LKRAKRLTKKERKAVTGPGPSGNDQEHQHQHIHCTACGAHLEEDQFGTEPPEALFLQCDHGSSFACCAECADKTRALLIEHDRTSQPVKSAELWH